MRRKKLPCDEPACVHACGEACLGGVHRTTVKTRKLAKLWCSPSTSTMRKYFVINTRAFSFVMNTRAFRPCASFSSICVVCTQKNPVMTDKNTGTFFSPAVRKDLCSHSMAWAWTGGRITASVGSGWQQRAEETPRMRVFWNSRGVADFLREFELESL